MDINMLRSLTVRVNGGSGVLIKPLSPDLLYIFTAYHCLKKHEGKPELSFGEGRYKDVTPVYKDAKFDENTDAAIILINRFSEDIPFIGLGEDSKGYSVDYPHLGYPKCREDEADRSRKIGGRNVKRLWGSRNGIFVEYEYEKNVTKEELEGMSGGGIFDESFRLLGVHKQSLQKDDKEFLGHALYIPCSHFKNIIQENGLPRVVEAGFSTFEELKDDLFDLRQMGMAKKKTEALLINLAVKLSEIVDLSPEELYNAFNDARSGCKPVPFENLLRHDWASFGEFVLVTSMMMNADVRKELDKIMNEFQYVHSDRDFDLAEAAKELNPSLIGFIKPNVKIVVGGIHDSGFSNDVMPYDKVPDIANALRVNGFDVAKSPHQLMQAFTYVNANIYKEAIVHYCNEIRDCEEDKLNFYISIIRKAIYEAEG